ncbi:MAG: phosphoadenosine phosphosulfate reductase [Fibrobacteria bacterium]|jgi:phosphoadenosine phosphosulfate reductase|nr:phosphoadenosine phosphosulfate reductase [Fibrobacteria bacterium]
MAETHAYPDLNALKARAEALNAEFASLDADARLRRAWELFGDRLIATTSFGRDAALLLHHLHRLKIPVRVYFMDTGFHFPETLAYRDTLSKAWGLDIRTVSSERTELERRQYAETETGPDGAARLRITNIDACCAINKVEVQRRFLALPDVDAFVSGLRRDQSPARKDMPFVAVQRGKIKIMPFLDWPHEDVDLYLRLWEAPEHPLAHLGYTSIGCSPSTCTRPPLPGEDARSGRWADDAKTECGIHLDTGF